jgi:hypothetical protein
MKAAVWNRASPVHAIAYRRGSDSPPLYGTEPYINTGDRPVERAGA